jgi:hypothetical protein
MERSFTYEIFKQECVGDSLGKHNFNILSLDSGICNLSSKILTTTNNNIPLMNSFADLSANIDIFNNNLPQMLNPLRFTRTYTGLNLLSAYWIRQEITVEYEFNKSDVQNIPEDIFLFNAGLYSNTKTFLSELSSLTYDYVSLNYPVSNFLNNAIMNVVVPLYANDGALIKTYSYANSAGQTVVTSTLPVYENIPSSKSLQEYRLISGTFEKKDDNFAATPIIRFLNKNNNWTFVNLTCAACIPTEQISVISSSLVDSSGIVRVNRGTSNVNTTGPCSPISFDYIYKRNVYSYATATVIGKTPDKIGTISLYFINPSVPNSSRIAYASVTPNLNQGFHTATLEWTRNAVNAYETSDAGTRLVRTWPIPYGVDPAIGFAFTKDDNGISYTACASKLLYPPDL